MELVNVYQAKTRLSELLHRVEAGEEIMLARAGRPVALLVPTGKRTTARVPGSMRGRIHLADDFDETSADLIESFHEEMRVYGDGDETPS